MKPEKWTNIYPAGTPEGDEEFKFFVKLARNPGQLWRSTSAISKETGLSKIRVEQIIQKYFNLGIVIQNPNNEDQWGYWENHEELLPKPQKTIAESDQDKRMGVVEWQVNWVNPLNWPAKTFTTNSGAYTYVFWWPAKQY